MRTWINRLPVCAMVYKEAAEILGYGEDEAKSLGLARAMFLAISKNIAIRIPKTGYVSGSIEEMRKAQSGKIMKFCGIGMHFVFQNNRFRGVVGNKLITPDGYDHDVEYKITMSSSVNNFYLLRRYIREGLSLLTKDAMNTKGVYDFYLKVRDEVRDEDFPKMLQRIQASQSAQSA